MIGGSARRIASPADAIAAGLGFATGKRAEEALAGDHDGQGEPLPQPAELRPDELSAAQPAARRRTEAAAILRRFDVRPPEPERDIGTLSGGNQQKVVLARWAGQRYRALVLEDPTIGVDVGAKAQIYRMMAEDAAAGTAAIVVSSDLDELVQICDRVLAFSRGRIVAELARGELSVEALTRAVGGIARAAAPRRARAMSAEPEIGAEGRAEPGDAATPQPPPRRPRRAALLHILSVHGLLVFGILLVIVFSILLPQTFTGIQTFRAILGNNTTVALLALAEMLVIATGNYDLSIAYNVGLMHILAMGLLTDAELPWPLVVVADHRRRRPGRLDQRRAGRIRQDRLLHRHARRRHHPLRRSAAGTPTAPSSSATCRRPSPTSTTPSSSAFRCRPTWSRRSRSSPGSASSTCRSAAGSTPSAPTAAPPS